MLRDIITYWASKTGNTTIVETQNGVRSVALGYINDAAQEVYGNFDLPGCLREIYINVPANRVIALPQWIGELRAARDKVIKLQLSVQTMMPRYTNNFWASYWRNWRFIGYGPLAADLASVGPLTFKQKSVSGISITITGQTPDALSETETIVLSALSVATTKSWVKVTEIVKSGPVSIDIDVEDGSGNNVGILYNKFLKSKYALYDVSTFPSMGFAGDSNFIIELLYKLPLFDLVEDTDELPVPDIEVLVKRKAVQLWMEDDETKLANAAALDGRITRDAQQLQKDKEVGEDKRMKFGGSPFIGMRRRYNYNRNYYNGTNSR